MPLNKDLERIVALAQAEVKCPCIAPRGLVCFHCAPRPDATVVIHGANCLNCHGTDKVPDPRFASLVEALTEECPACGGVGLRRAGFDPTVILYCGKCNDLRGRVLRTWSDLPQGALAGVYKQWTNTRPRPSTKASLYILADNLTDCFGQPDCNERATRFVLAFMKEATHA